MLEYFSLSDFDLGVQIILYEQCNKNYVSYEENGVKMITDPVLLLCPDYVHTYPMVHLFTFHLSMCSGHIMLACKAPQLEGHVSFCHRLMFTSVNNYKKLSLETTHWIWTKQKKEVGKRIFLSETTEPVATKLVEWFLNSHIPKLCAASQPTNWNDCHSGI